MPERYLNDRRILRLSDGAFRAFVTATIWSVSNRTDGVIEDGDIALIAHMTPGHVQELLREGLWTLRAEGGYLIEDFGVTQTSRDELETLDNIRRADREKKRRQRAAKRDATPFVDPVTGEVPRDGPGDVSPGTAQERTGKARQGQARAGEAGTGDQAGSPFGRQENEMQRRARQSFESAAVQ
jgi:hypothetical protein